LIVAAAAFAISGLTVFSGFGLGTLLLPVFAIFFPVEVAVAATAVVHAANSLLKASVFGKDADWAIVLRFGIPAIVAAFLGAAALGLVAGLPPMVEYTIGSHRASVTPVKLILGVLMVGFALFELLPRLRAIRFDRKRLVLGGLLSGFFGGLSGHQGALRSAFLAKMEITTEAFVGTTAVVALLVDLARISVYWATFSVAGSDLQGEAGRLALSAIAAAFVGVIVGRQFVGAVTMKMIQTLTGIMLLGVALALGSGLI
jgi:uncharacterized membrane protein YfcA